MSFETLIWLGLTLLFVIAPLFGNRGKNDQKQQPRQPGQRPGQPPAQGQPRTRTGVPHQQPAQQQDSALESRLEEARRRIEEAIGAEKAQVPQQTRAQPPVSAQPAARPASSVSRQRTGAQVNRAAPAATPAPAARQVPAAARAGTQQRQPQAQAQRPRSADRSRASAAATSQRTSTLRESARSSTDTELQVTRLDRRPTYTVRRRRLDDRGLFESQNVMYGIVWHQILSEPPYKRGNRRRTSRLRSP